MNPSSDRIRPRIVSVDILRGLVMVIMVLDHARDYFSLTPFDPSDLAQTDAALYFTRWITHFCAPVFVFLSGTSAWLYRRNKHASKRELSWFLVTRGLWLMLIELTLINFLWQFTVNLILLQVIWVIGLSMVCMALLIHLPRSVIGLIGLALIVLHNGLLDPIKATDLGSGAWLWQVLHERAFWPTPNSRLWGVAMAYPLIPWVGVMALGYWFGAIIEKPSDVRTRQLFLSGGIALTVFLVLRGFNLYGEPGIPPALADWREGGYTGIDSVMAFLNTSKYPPSLLFLCMTLGPALMLMPWMETWRGHMATILTVFGRVPFLFYVLHIALIHMMSSIWTYLSFGRWQFHYLNSTPFPEGYTYELWRGYVVWIVTVALLYWPCKRFMEYRKTHSHWWLSYL
ncbi:MAG: heparan-alpha-glucosaminide N-acetyltransferase domain-containing protein [Pseudomonadota bacterium]